MPALHHLPPLCGMGLRPAEAPHTRPLSGHRLPQSGAVPVIGCVDGEDRYDGNTAPHGHFVCRSCGAVIDLPPIPVELPDMSEVGEPDSCGVVFYGRCNGCLAEKKTS